MKTKLSDKTTYKIQLFDAKKHDRSGFSCGISSIDNYLKLTAKKASKNDMVRIWVIIDQDNKIIGFYGINMHSIIAKDMPQTYAKKALKNGTLPAAFISMIGVNKIHQGNGIGKILLADALLRIYKISNEIGTCAVLLDIFDDGDKKAINKRKNYYKKFGFIQLPDQPLRYFIPIQSIKDLV